MNFINTISCPIKITEINPVNGSQAVPNFQNGPLLVQTAQNLISPPIYQRHLYLHFELPNESCTTSGMKSWEGRLELIQSGLQSVVITEFEGKILVETLMSPEDVGKSKEGNAKLRYYCSF